MYVPYSQRNTPACLAAARASREQDEADALANWRHVRRLADATDTTPTVTGPAGSMAPGNVHRS